MQYNTIALQQPRDTTASGSMDLSSLLGVQIGKDTTGNFALTLSGLGVLGRDGRYYSLTVRDGLPRLLDVTSLVVPIDPGVYRLPAQKVYPGDLILISDNPFSAMYVMEVGRDDRLIIGMEATCNELVTYFPPFNPVGGLFFGEDTTMFVRIVSMFDLLQNMFGESAEEHR